MGSVEPELLEGVLAAAGKPCGEIRSPGVARAILSVPRHRDDRLPLG